MMLVLDVLQVLKTAQYVGKLRTTVPELRVTLPFPIASDDTSGGRMLFLLRAIDRRPPEIIAANCIEHFGITLRNSEWKQSQS